MAYYESIPHQPPSSKPKTFLTYIFIFSIFLLFVVISLKQGEWSIPFSTSKFFEVEKKPSWFEVIAKDIDNIENIKIGLVNLDKNVDSDMFQQLHALQPQIESVPINFDHVNESLKWLDFYPHWINEEGKSKCPKIPMPRLENYKDLNVVVAKLPCVQEGLRDLFWLQINLVVANLVVESGWVEYNNIDMVHKKVYVVFVGYCEPMLEIFRCDDLLMHQGEYFVYQPDLRRLKQKTLMPLGSCEIAPISSISGKELQPVGYTPKLAYVSILHSSEAYVCGAIALAQSILQNKGNKVPTPDLVLLVDNSIGPKSIIGLKKAGWKIKHIKPISNPYSKNGSYNELNYSKLRMWQLTMYDKIIFMDSDILVHKNIDEFFSYPELSVANNEYYSIFNSGFMIIEPSQCMFDHLMQKIYTLEPNNGSDQSFLNEVFAWWHRLPRKLNVLKHFRDNEKHELPEDSYVIHYFGLKPWMCDKRDYDCNWDIKFHNNFASDSVYKRWWKVHDGMSKELQYYCRANKEGVKDISEISEFTNNREDLIEGDDKIIIRQRVEGRNVNLTVKDH